MFRRLKIALGLGHADGPREGELDLVLFGAAMALMALGALFVTSASLRSGVDPSAPVESVWMHAVHVACGLAALVVALRVPSETLRKGYPVLVALTFVLMLLVLALGEEKGGAKRWLALGPVTLQPSEFLKIVLGLYLAGYLSRRYTLLNDLQTGIVPLGVFYAAFAALLALQPDIGSVVLLGTLVGLMLLVGGTRLTLLGLIVGVMLAAFLVLIVLSPEKLARLVGWWLPDETQAGDGYQVFNARIVIGSGGLFGAGLGQGIHHALGYLPQSDTDFLFAVAAEETGWVGVAVIVLLYAAIAVRGLALATRCRDEFSRYAAFAMTLLLTLPALVHMAVCLGLMPTKGLVLPFMSYGGSAMVASFVTLGILERLHLEATARPVGSATTEGA